MKALCPFRKSLSALVFLVATGLMVWRSSHCILRFLEDRRTSEVKMLGMEATLMPTMTVCPPYHAAYKEQELDSHGINNQTTYKQGDLTGNSKKDGREIFTDVTYRLDEVIKSLLVRFAKGGDGGTKRMYLPEQIQSHVIRHPNLGVCYELQLAQFKRPLEYVKFVFKVEGFVWVNVEGQFHNRDSFSKVEVKMGHCLFIEMTYEVVIQTEEVNCRRYGSGKEGGAGTYEQGPRKKYFLNVANIRKSAKRFL